MNKLPISARIIITLCFFFACLMGTVSLVAVALTSAEIGGGLPLRYFEELNFPVLMVFFPVVGMIVIGAIAFVLRLGEKKIAEPKVAENATSTVVISRPKSAEIYTKAA